MKTQKEGFTAYAIATDYRRNIPNVPFDHTFVISDSKDDWNCWGRGIETVNAGARMIGGGRGLAEWAKRIYGDPNAPTGLTQYVDGVCQNAANRILLLAAADVSQANADFLVVLLYGKYGYGLSDFIAKLKSTAASINTEAPGTISDPELQTILGQVGDDAEDELRILESHFRQALPSTITDTQTSQLLSAYRDFQNNRQQAYVSMQPKRNDPSFQDMYAKAMGPALAAFLKKCSNIVGPSLYNSVFKLALEEAVPFLLKTPQ